MQVYKNVNLQAYHTFGIEVFTEAFAVLKNREDLFQLKSLRKQYKDFLILGGGSNVLFVSNYPGIIIQNKLSGIDILQEDEESIILKVASGMNWHDLVITAVSNNWGGIENLSLIPGTVGAAPIQNIGAYGVEVKEVIQKVIAFDLEKEEFITFTNVECQFGYRDSIFKHSENKGKYFITDIIIQLKKNPTAFKVSYGDIQKIMDLNQMKDYSVKTISDAVIQIRQQKLPDPKDIGNSGSFFKNPEISTLQAQELLSLYPSMPQYKISDSITKIPAAWLIEQCGWKGLKVGNTGNHAQQALVIVNYGNATGEEIRQHAINVQKSVWDKFQIELQPEVNFLPY
jgi:UDP-N-acetylmuramate dehydrogenase